MIPNEASTILDFQDARIENRSLRIFLSFNGKFLTTHIKKRFNRRPGKAFKLAQTTPWEGLLSFLLPARVLLKKLKAYPTTLIPVSLFFCHLIPFSDDNLFPASCLPW